MPPVVPPFRPLRSAVVTGAGGFVGATLVRTLRAAGTAVVGLDSLERGYADSLPVDVPLVRGDVTDPAAVLPCLRPLPAGRMEGYPVSTLVSSPGNEGPRRVQPVS